MLLALRDVGKTWLIKRTGERVVALQSISLDVQAGEFLIFLGPSGCGKSTLLQIIAGLEAPSSGEIRFPQARGHAKLTSMVFQDYALFPWRTVLGNVVFGPEVRHVARAEREVAARRLIELVNLTGAEHRYPHELSGGMRQRVALARALANDPQILLFETSRWPLSMRRPAACFKTSCSASGGRRARRLSTSRTACRKPCCWAVASCS